MCVVVKSRIIEKSRKLRIKSYIIMNFSTFNTPYAIISLKEQTYTKFATFQAHRAIFLFLNYKLLTED